VVVATPTSAQKLNPTDAATAVEAASLLVGLAINDTHQPVEQMGAALERIQNTLTVLRRESPSSRPGMAFEAGFVHDVATCIEGLQFHDRLMQQLAFVRDLLAAILEKEPSDLAAYGERRWIALLAVIRQHAPLDPRFELFDLLSTTEAHAAEGSCELFE
jgi:hypothetical protein